MRRNRLGQNACVAGGAAIKRRERGASERRARLGSGPGTSALVTVGASDGLVDMAKEGGRVVAGASAGALGIKGGGTG